MGLRQISRTGARPWSLLSTCVLLLLAVRAWGYRPFVSTDAAVADPKEMELELGYLGLRRAQSSHALIAPQIVLNYGVARNWEVVGEFTIEEPSNAGARLVDPGLFLKAVMKEGILQNKDSLSFAVEVGPLLPATTPGERKFGFEGVGIVSGRFSPFMYHVNFGGGVERTGTNPFALWGVIVELPVFPRVRLVGEINGESAKEKLANNSGLLGFIWQPSLADVLIDVGIRKGISRQAADWQVTTGLTWSFSLPFLNRVSRFGGTP